MKDATVCRIKNSTVSGFMTSLPAPLYVHDFQTTPLQIGSAVLLQACILIIYGDNPVASENLVLGQFDILNIPPAPKKVPRIEVTFHLDKNLFLTVSARDLDSCRQVEWAQRDIIVRSA